MRQYGDNGYGSFDDIYGSMRQYGDRGEAAHLMTVTDQGGSTETMVMVHLMIVTDR
jgi:hypothetical protein